MALVLFFKPGTIKRFSKLLLVLLPSTIHFLLNWKFNRKWESVPCKKGKMKVRKLPNSLTLPLLIVSTCACVEYFGRALESLIKKVTVHLIHGKMKHKRNKIFADFRALKRSEPAGGAQTAHVQPWCWLFLTTVQSASQRYLGVHWRDGQRNRYSWCQLGAAVRSAQQCQVSHRNQLLPVFLGKIFILHGGIYCSAFSADVSLSLEVGMQMISWFICSYFTLPSINQ